MRNGYAPCLPLILYRFLIHPVLRLLVVIDTDQRSPSMLRGVQRLSLVACGALGVLIACLLMVPNWGRLSLVRTVQAQGNPKPVIIGGHQYNFPIEVDIAPPPGTVRENPKDGLKYVLIPPGTFMMGCSPGKDYCGYSKPAHRVTLTRPFWLGQTPVTVGGYRRFREATKQKMPPDPDFNRGWTNPRMPMILVSWNDSEAYCEWIGGRLPTEAEWEYAARGGNPQDRYGNVDEIAWHALNSGRRPPDVAQKLPNKFGLYDMLGNVFEWVSDWFDEDYYQYSPSQNPPGPEGGLYRVLRGAAWVFGPEVVSASRRSWEHPGAGNGLANGFRCAMQVNML